MFNQFSTFFKDNELRAWNRACEFLRKWQGRTEVVVPAYNERRLPNFGETRQRVMSHDHIDALQSNLPVFRTLGVRCRAIDPCLNPFGMFARVSG